MVIKKSHEYVILVGSTKEPNKIVLKHLLDLSQSTNLASKINLNPRVYILSTKNYVIQLILINLKVQLLPPPTIEL